MNAQLEEIKNQYKTEENSDNFTFNLIGDINKIGTDIQQTIIATIISADMANKAEEITKGMTSPQDKCIAVAQWVSENIIARNGGVPSEPLRDDVYGWYADRTALCGGSSLIFSKMLNFLNIENKILYLYDFPMKGNSHVTVQAYYDNSWHYYDPSYAGIFMDNNNVMDFRQILEDPEYAIKNMRIFSDSKEIGHNEKRMKATYTRDSLTGYKSYAAQDEIATVYPDVNVKNLPTYIGTTDNSMQDVRDEGGDEGYGLFLSFATGGSFRQIKTDWHFKNCEQGKEYYIKYVIYNPQNSETIYTARPENAKIIEGETFNLTPSQNEWIIKFTPNQSECSILIDYDIPPTEAVVDMIEIGLINA